MVSVSVSYKENLPHEEVVRSYGRIVAYSTERVEPEGLEMKTVRDIQVTANSANYIVGAHVGSPGRLNVTGSDYNYAEVYLYDAGTAGAPTEIGSAKRRTLEYVAIGE